MSGSVEPEQWGVAVRSVDFYDVKGDIEALFAMTKSPADFKLCTLHTQCFASGQSASIVYQNGEMGWMGKVHPAVAQSLDLKVPFICLKFCWIKSRKVSCRNIKRFQKSHKSVVILHFL